ncbi:methionine biosynthesis protein MetW [bacterium]|nr:methionine biosynthesis protein MetW [bacterium]
MENNRGIHLNYSVITKIIEENSSVLDLGCGDGTLLKSLIDNKHVKGKGIEINQESVISCLEKGVCTIQGDIDEGLIQFSNKEYDYVILNRTVQATEHPDLVIKEMLRVGKKAIVSFPNFAYWRVRMYLLFNGRMPVSKMLPYEWYNTPNIHLLTIKDFFDFTKNNNIKILKSIYLNHSKVRKDKLLRLLPNILAEEAVFVLSN